jgi:hypothetical protein
MNAMKTELSPAAQAVLDAYMTGYGWLDGPCHKDCLGVAAAALRAVADQVVPIDRGSRRQCNIRAALIAIAAELEGQL